MRDIPELVDGYRRFLATRYPDDAALYRTLAEAGQAPKTMVIACCDSRVDPAAIFSAAPGELFIIRNVANLVPPFEAHGDYNGTSAALEFAVTGLEVKNIVVMGHARCGGVRAFLDSLHEQTASDSFVDRWMSQLNGARTVVQRDGMAGTLEDQQRALEQASVRQSLKNLQTFPFVKERLADDRLRLRGAYFDIADGKLLSLASDSGQFSPLD